MPAITVQHTRAFTLIELLTVILLITIVISIGIPVLGQMLEITRGRAGSASISVAVNAARILNHRMAEDDKGAIVPGADYSGTAALFTPGGEIRFVINNQLAKDTPSTYLETNNFNGYKDVNNTEYLTLPKSSGIAGIMRTSLGTVAPLPPPFAIRFDEFGHLALNEPYIYYDSNYNGFYNITDIHPQSGYDPDQWDPRRNSSMSPNTTRKRYRLPFEQIQVVMAVVLYDVTDFHTEGLNWATSSSSALSNWLTNPDNVTPIYFSPHSGLMLKE